MKTKYYAGMTTLLVVVVMGFAACSAGSKVDAAAVTAALNAEKAKYQTGINLSGLKAGDEVSGKVVELIEGKKANPAITRSVLYVSSGQIVLTETGSLMFQSAEVKTGDEREDGITQAPDKTSDPEDGGPLPVRIATRDIQVVTLQFEKDGITSTLDVLVALKGDPADGATWLGYGYDQDTSTVKKPVLDLEKLHAAGWIEENGGKDVFKYTDADAELNAEVLAMFAAQSFIDDVLSETTGEIQADYGTHLIANAAVGKGNLGTPAGGDLISLTELVERVKEDHLWQDANRQAWSRGTAPRWVKAGSIKIITKSSAIKSLFIEEGKYTVTNVYTGRQWDNGEGSVPTDLNETAMGPHIYVLFEGTDRFEEAVADLCIVEGKTDRWSKPPDGYVKLGTDLNKGNDGDYVYLCYKPFVLGEDSEAVAWIGGYSQYHQVKTGSVTKVIKGKSWTGADDGQVRWVWGTNYKHKDWPADANQGTWFAKEVYLTQEKIAYNEYSWW